jgi:hypothetical protein
MRLAGRGGSRIDRRSRPMRRYRVMPRHSQRPDSALLDALKLHLSTDNPASEQDVPLWRRLQHPCRPRRRPAVLPAGDAAWLTVLGLPLCYARAATGVPLLLLLPIIAGVIIELIVRFHGWRERCRADRIFAGKSLQADLPHHSSNSAHSLSSSATPSVSFARPSIGATWMGTVEPIERRQRSCVEGGAELPRLLRNKGAPYCGNPGCFRECAACRGDAARA